jgi:hypothetical protein
MFSTFNRSFAQALFITFIAAGVLAGCGDGDDYIVSREAGKTTDSDGLRRETGRMMVALPDREPHMVRYELTRTIQKGDADFSLMVTDEMVNVSSLYTLKDDIGLSTLSVIGKAAMPVSYNPDGTISIEGKVFTDQNLVGVHIYSDDRSLGITAEAWTVVIDLLTAPAPAPTSKGGVAKSAVLAAKTAENVRNLCRIHSGKRC